MKADSFNPFEMAQAQFDKVADIINLEPGVRKLLVIRCVNISFRYLSVWMTDR